MNIQMRNGDDDIGTTFTILLTTTFREIDNYTLFCLSYLRSKNKEQLIAKCKIFEVDTVSQKLPFRF